MISVYEYIEKINQRLEYLPGEDRYDIDILLRSILEACELQLERGPTKTSILRQLAKYADRKISDERASYILEKSGSHNFRNLRNELVHGGSFKKYSELEKQNLEIQFWKALEKSAVRWDPWELRNFLSYCIPSEKTSTASTPNGIVKFYQARFYELPEFDQEFALKELIVRIFSDPALREYFEPSKRVE